MRIYCIEDFKNEFVKLTSKSSYKHLEPEAIKYFFNKPVKDLLSGIRLNHSNEAPYIKKRIGGSGGFRCYFLVLIKNESLYLMFVHPKSGAKGSSNVKDDSKAYLYKKVLSCIKEKKLYELKLNKNKITFNKCR